MPIKNTNLSDIIPLDLHHPFSA